MAWIKIDNDIYAQETENPIMVLSLSELKNELTILQGIYNNIGENIIHEDENYANFINEEKEKKRFMYGKRITETQNLINELLTV